MNSDLTFSKANESTPVSSVAYPIQPPAVLPRLFDATCGLIHYFVRPNDEFALNSLELLDADAYLYRLLKFEGYERVAFVEVEKTNCRIWAYDALSERIFQAADSGGLKDLMIRPSRSKPAAVSSPAAAGKRKGQSPIYTAEEFQKTFVAEINLALENADHKTAVVLPMSIFEKEGFLSDVIIDTVNRLERVGNGENILVLTMPQRDDLWLCFGGKQARLHSWTAPIAANPDRLDVVKEALRELKSQGMIVLADEYRTDEIANLLLRKKHLFQDSILADIPDTVVYELANRLKEHCTEVRDHMFEHIPYLNRKGNCIRSLNKLLDRPEVQRELAEKAMAVPAQSIRIAYSQELRPLLLERVYHLNLRRYETSSAMDKIRAEFDEHVGKEMEQVKTAVFRAINTIIKDKEAAAQTGKDRPMNMVFYGPPGTGKTTIARLTARYLHAVHVLPTEKTVEKSARNLVSSHIGGTGEKIREAFDEADGGVLFIDEFHDFDNAHQHGNLAQEALGAVVAGINEHWSSVCVIIAGYEDGVQHVFQYNTGALRRFPYKIYFQAYSMDTLMFILETKLKKYGKRLEDGAGVLLRRVIESDKDVLREQLGNAGYLENLIDSLGGPQDGKDGAYTREDILRAFPEKRRALAGGGNADEILDEFDRYAGEHMRKIKAAIKKAADDFIRKLNRIQRLKEAGKTVSDDEMPFINLKFLGPPGTGKTTAARLTAAYFNARGILHRSDVKKVQAATLVKGAVGGTTAAIQEAAQDANGGVLIIDEFQDLEISFTGGNTASEAIHAIVNAANKYQGSLCMIVAGYEEDVERIFKYDPGADSRFRNVIYFENYDLPALMEIFDLFLRERELQIEPDARALTEQVILRVMNQKGRSFGNARDIRDIVLEELEGRQEDRDPEDMCIRREDVFAAFPEVMTVAIKQDRGGAE